MYIFGKIFGAIFGFFLAGPIGCLLGIGIGHLFDKGLAFNVRFTGENVSQAKRSFFATTFRIMGYIAKADGRVSEQEIALAKKIMAQLHLNPEQRQNAINYFNQGKSKDFDYEQALEEFVNYCGMHLNLVQLFFEIQIQVAFADGIENPNKRKTLEQICRKLNMDPRILQDLEARFFAEQQFFRGGFAGFGGFNHGQSSRGYSSQTYTRQDELAAAYQILGVAKGTPLPEVKKAYRKLMSQHHPDKLVAKGLPEEMIKMATEKTQKIQKAYELICKAG